MYVSRILAKIFYVRKWLVWFIKKFIENSLETWFLAGNLRIRLRYDEEAVRMTNGVLCACSRHLLSAISFNHFRFNIIMQCESQPWRRINDNFVRKLSAIHENRCTIRNVPTYRSTIVHSDDFGFELHNGGDLRLRGWILRVGLYTSARMVCRSAIRRNLLYNSAGESIAICLLN